MLIKKLKLENIRSYLNQEINFQEGSVLLSGNIGSGKSSILLAIEFALFGLIKGEISGGSLLRKGSEKGSVELCFDINDNEIIIKRTLKKSSSGIAQDAGYIIINGRKKDATAVELKQNILELLNYPQELLNKKSLIYRYTVYTPQEEMKNILLGDLEYRLDTLRRVFNIDKYKRIRENAKIVIAKLKEKKNEYEIRASGIEAKKEELKNKESDLNKNKILMEDINSKLKIIKDLAISKKKEINSIEEETNKFREFKREFEICEINLGNKQEKLKFNSKRIKELDDEINEIKSKFSVKTEDVSSIISKKEIFLNSLETELKDNYKKLNRLKISKENSEKIMHGIIELDECQTCMQKVSNEYKKNVVAREEGKIWEINKELELLLKRERESDEAIESVKKEMQLLRKKESESGIIKMKQSELELKNKLKLKLNEEEIIIRKEVDDLEIKNIKLNKIINEFKLDEEKIIKFRQELDEIIRKERDLDIKFATMNNEIRNSEAVISILKKEIETSLQFVEKLKKVRSLKENIEDNFIKLMETIEKSIMLKVHHDFDSLFRKWFEMLVDSELIKVRLDNEFSPLIEQNGYDIDYEHLSGGEKTAAALAYRLALNQVINNLVEGINTKDLIILDEPTDGFSSEQLDRMKNVLDDLNMKQIIIVSHEDKIESFVEKVIRFEKKEHVSYVK